MAMEAVAAGLWNAQEEAKMKAMVIELWEECEAARVEADMAMAEAQAAGEAVGTASGVLAEVVAATTATAEAEAAAQERWPKLLAMTAEAALAVLEAAKVSTRAARRGGSSSGEECEEAAAEWEEGARELGVREGGEDRGSWQYWETVRKRREKRRDKK